MKQLSENLFYIGVDDLDLDLFESQYPVPEGMAYNSYLLKGQKIAILDTADARKADEWLANLQEALAGAQPDYLVIHHLEPDHSAVIARVMELYPGLTVACSAKAVQMLAQFFPEADFSGRTLALKEGEALDLGGRSLKFLGAPMVHWPEVMVSYDNVSGTLFSADAFGKFGALSKCGFFGEDEEDWACEARRYYFNICGKYGTPVQTLLKKVSALDVKAIAPAHGPILRKELEKYIGLYNIWSRYEAEKEGVLVAYASIHGGTAKAAKVLGEIIAAKGLKAKVIDVARMEVSEAVEDAFSYNKVVLAASSYDGGLFPPMYDFLHHLQDKAWQKRRIGIVENGSWAPCAGRIMKDMVSGFKEMEVLEPVVTLKSVMKEDDKAALENLANEIIK
ncbi:MAG: FprA family A-type flavoprotein [Bacteroidales bacterium]|nr:FprA family A-type flavoprotein [Bacteroidales bacterium]